MKDEQVYWPGRIYGGVPMPAPAGHQLPSASIEAVAPVSAYEEVQQPNIQAYLGWLRANGIEQEPTIEQADGDKIEGYVPPTYIVWRNGTGVLKQTVSLIDMEAANGSVLGPEQAAKHAMYFVTGSAYMKYTWRDFTTTTSAPVPTPPADPMVGVVCEGDGSIGSLFYVTGSGVQEGATYQMPGNGPKFVCIARGMFDRKWKRIA